MDQSKSKNIFNTVNYLDYSFDTTKYLNIMSKYNELIIDYLKYIYSTIKINNQDYFIFIINRGLQTVNHVFNILLLYTRNLELIDFHIKKAYLYYVEFVGQISEDNNSYLQLSSKDAMLFVYKKTIFELNNDFRKKEHFSESKKENFLLIYDYIKLNTKIINHIFDYNVKSENEYLKLKKQMTKTMKVYIKSSINRKLIEKFINHIILLKENEEFIEYYRLFINKLHKMNKQKKLINERQFSKKRNHIEDKIENYIPSKMINWLFN